MHIKCALYPQVSFPCLRPVLTKFHGEFSEYSELTITRQTLPQNPE